MKAETRGDFVKARPDETASVTSAKQSRFCMMQMAIESWCVFRGQDSHTLLELLLDYSARASAL